MRKAAYQVLGVLMMGTWLAAQNVGIGTTTPLTRFHVAAGDIFLGDALGNDGYVIHTRPWLGYDLLQITSRAGGNWEWGKGITYVRTSGFVGIGQPTPTQRLHIAGSTLTENAYAAKPLELTAGTNCPVIINAPATQVLITPGGADCGGPATITYTATPIEGQYLWITNLSGSNRTFYGFPVRNNEVIGFVYTNAAWRTVGFTDANTFWRLTGNAGTNPANNFVGTTDAQPLVFRTNNAERMRILADGRVGIGTSTPNSRFHLADGELAMMDPAGNVGFLMAVPGNHGYYGAWALYGVTGGNLNSAPFLYARRSTNSLGIGTVNPTAQLHTTGTVRFQNYASGPNGAILGTDNLGNLTLTNFTGNANDVLLGNGTFGIPPGGGATITCPTFNYVPKITAANQLGCSQIFDNATNVGIATTSPNAKLHIANGDVRVGEINSNISGLPSIGRRIYLSGGSATTNPFGGPPFDSENTDFLWIARRNVQSNETELLINIGDDYQAEDALALVIDHPCCLYRQFMRVESRGRLAIFPYGNRARARLDITQNTTAGGEFGPGTGVSSDVPSLAIIEAAATMAQVRHNDWPVGWGGGLSTWDICANQILHSGLTNRSDRRYKNSILELRPQYPDIRTRFMQLQPVSYYYNPGVSNDPQRLHFGFIANDVETLFPNLVSNAGADPEIHRGLNYEEIIPLLVLMVQEQEKALSNQQAIIQQLQVENAQLRQLQVENAQLRSQLQTLSEQVQALYNRHITGMK
jgi:hypothetical protein